ncbi:hypothetical protein H261_11699 [Paramagnetospirillum caucaseum]|uniref:UPF0262 protein H261_11699 n=1 Tax=Paramagnetospirillum caucaseum TaxID=1244869 RepID=M3AAB1_9PROT|nr:UPF0262 family protein [Paramagnetospirillum caucaseum]EME69698.1 hypothetical protein H261_11699 [Paramagnetospirillum caucaseum]
MPHRQKLAKIELVEKHQVRRAAEVEHERAVAVYDLLEENYFAPNGDFIGPYALYIKLEETRLVFDVRKEDESPLVQVPLPLKTFQSIVKDYFLICESYFAAIKKSTPSQIEAIDMGRRGLHNEGSELLRERLGGKIDVDFDTARRLFTLICVLHIRG